MGEKANEGATGHPWLRALVAILVGFLGSVLIWITTPYSNFIIHSSYIVDSFMPPAALAVILLLVLGVNPLLRLLRPRWSLDRAQLATSSGMMLVATHLPGQGLLRMLPYSIARVPVSVRQNARLSEIFEQMGIPSSLFPDKIGFGVDTPISDSFLAKLLPGEAVPWEAWVPPLLAWGAFMLSVWLMMVGMAMIVLPQWRRNERLAFPLLTVYQSLIETPDGKGLFAPLFRNRSFWIAAGAVFLLHLLAGLKVYNPDGVPAVPLNWDLSRFFAEEPLRYLPGHIKHNRIYFIFLGMAFFMPGRIGFSLWFFTIAYAIYQVVGNAYFPPYYGRTVMEHRMGATLSMTLFVLWLGRAHWVHVFRCLFRPVTTEADRRDRKSGAMFLFGCAGMFAWMVWIGVQVHWALFYVFFGFMITLIVTRIVAETGVPFIRLDCGYQISLLRLFPISWIGPVSLYFSYAMAMIFPTGSRVSAGTLGIHAIGLDERAPPKRQWRYAVVLVALLVVGLAICGAVHVFNSYHHSVTLDGEQQPISDWGTNRLEGGHTALLEWKSGRLSMPPYSQVGHLTFGAGLAALLQWLCLMSPRWPLHPMGLIMVHTMYANDMWVSVFIGWFIKLMLLRYGGPRAYRVAQPAFLGLIMGEVFAAVFWGIEPAVRVFLGLPYIAIKVQPY